MKKIGTLAAVAIGFFVACSVPLGTAIAQNSNDIVVSPVHIKQKIEEAKAGKLDYEFAAFLGQAAENALLQALKNSTAQGWWDSASEKYEAVLALYEAGKAEPVYVAATAIRLGAVNMHRNRLGVAEQLFHKGVSLLEGYSPASNTQLVKREYAFGLGFLGRVYRLQDRTQLANETLSKALSFAKKHFGDDSPEVAELKEHMR